jgi:hypothetical protein
MSCTNFIYAASSFLLLERTAPHNQSNVQASKRIIQFNKVYINKASENKNELDTYKEYK